MILKEDKFYFFLKYLINYKFEVFEFFILFFYCSKLLVLFIKS